MRYLLVCISFFLAGCAVKNPVINQYKLDTYSMRAYDYPHPALSLFITPPETAYTYQSEQMFYTKKNHTISAFVHNAWISPPATMLFPLMLQSFQSSGYFRAVLTSANVGEADYRLDTQLITLQQNFLTKPSVLELCIKIVLTKISEERVVASRIFQYHIPCVEDTPYAGVVAANAATKEFTAQVTDFVISHLKSR